MKEFQAMKENKVIVKEMQKGSEKLFHAYGNKAPLTVHGNFEEIIQIGPELSEESFYVVKEGNMSLLGSKTAKKLKVLQINKNSGDLGKFPFMKDITIHIQIDPRVKPVNQPLRRTPLEMESLIENEMKDLLEEDMIEPVIGYSSWQSPIVPVSKGIGKIRLCVDMRADL